jgi:hypothetical protein
MAFTHRSYSRARVKPALVALLVLFAVSGCGGSERKPAPTRAAFVAATDAICTHATTRSGRVARLRALRPPIGQEDLYAHWLRAERDALEAAKPRKHPPKPDEPDPAVALAIAEGKIAGYARRLGAEACVRTATGTLPP